MDNRIFYLLILCVLVGMGVLLFFNVSPYLPMMTGSERLLPSEVRSMAVEHEGKLYSLNFAQQNALLNYLNQAQLTQEPQGNKQPWPGISRIVIYRFNKPEIEIQPLTNSSKTLFFKASMWDPNGLFLDTSKGEMAKLLQQIYKEKAE